MQQDNNAQAPFNQNQYQQNAYSAYPPQQSGYPQFNSQAPYQGSGGYPQYNNYNGYQPNPQGVVYNAQSYQQPYGQQPQAQVVVRTEQMQAMASQNAAQGIESRILSNFCCYTCLVYFELLISVSSLIYNIIIVNEFGYGGYIALNVSAAVVMILACIIALVAKANFDRQKQNWAIAFFTVATILTITTTVLILIFLENYQEKYTYCDSDGTDYNPYDNTDYPYNYNDYTDDFDCVVSYAVLEAERISYIAAIPIQLLIGLALICSAYSISQLLKQRDRYLQDAKDNLNMAVVITA